MNTATDWMTLFPEDRSRDAYRRAMRARTPLDWEVIEESQGDLLRLIVDRVSADIGAQVIMGLTLLLREHPAAEEASRLLLGTIMRDVAPPRARTLLIAVSDAWSVVQHQPPYRGPELMRAALARAVRRLVVLDIPESERNALRAIRDMLNDEPDASRYDGA